MNWSTVHRILSVFGMLSIILNAFFGWEKEFVKIGIVFLIAMSLSIRADTIQIVEFVEKKEKSKCVFF